MMLLCHRLVAVFVLCAANLQKTACHEDSIFDCIIVGGGLSGLWAARQLQKQANLSVLVIEARPYVGGRTQALKMGNATIDLGGEFVGSTQPHILHVMENFGLRPAKVFTDGKKVLDLLGKKSEYRIPLPPVPDLALLLFKVHNDLRKVCGSGPDAEAHCKYLWDNRTFSSFARDLDAETVSTFGHQFGLNDASRAFAHAALHPILGKEPEDLSVLSMGHYAEAAGGILPLISTGSKGAGQEATVVGGTTQISEKLMEEIISGMRGYVHLSEKVLQLSQTSGIEGGGIIVTTAGVRGTGGPGGMNPCIEPGSCASDFSAIKQYKARRAIVALPPHLAVRLEYVPPLLPAKDHLLNRMPQGHTIKAIPVYSRPFWKEKGFSGEVVSDGLLSWCVDNSNSGMPSLLCFIGGAKAVEFSPKSSGERKSAVLSLLAKYFGEEALHPVEYIEKDWGLEPFTGGCPVGSANGNTIVQFGHMLREAHMKSVNGTGGLIRFGGTETATVWYGFMNGAIQSGQRCAIEVMEELGIPVPNEMFEFLHVGEKTSGGMQQPLPVTI